MERTLTRFIGALRNAEVRISTAETLDAFDTLQLVGYRDKATLKRALSLTLPKSADEKAIFSACFDDFFSFDSFAPLPAAGDGQADGAEADAQGDGAGGGASVGESQPSDSGLAQGERTRSQRKVKRRRGPDAASEATGIQRTPLTAGPTAAPESALGRLLMTDSRVELSLAMSAAGEAVQVRNIQVFTQKGIYTRRIMDAMGLADLNREITDAEASDDLPRRRLGRTLRQKRDWLREEVRDHVERQFLLHADADGKRLREALLRKVKLSHVEHRNFHLLQEIVLKMAKRLATLYARRRKVSRRGVLNVPRTLRHNMAYDGAVFDLRWKAVRIDRPRVFAVCDVSGSVARYVRFMLMFLYSLEEAMPKVRAFAFSSDLAEVTELFSRYPLDNAIARTLHDHAGGSTDYGQALADFKRLCLDDVDKRATIVILGDARNNYGESRAEILKEIYDRARRVIWLNPEGRGAWNTGDSEMRRYATWCHQVEECNSLAHLERVVGNLLRSSQ